MLAMSCIYFNIWQIKQTEPRDFEKAMVGFNKEIEKELLEATSPFTFWRVNESTILRFLKLIGCDNGKIGKYAVLVKERNDSAHSNGHIFCNEQSALDCKMTEILRVVNEIQSHSKPIIEHCCRNFLLESCDLEVREYLDAADQIREVLIHQNYLSPKDIELCLGFDISGLSTCKHYDEIQELHNILITEYKNDDE